MSFTTEFVQTDTIEKFYGKKFYFSYSSINRLLECPEIFYKEYILGEKDELTGQHISEGKLIHNLLLEPQNFDKQFIVMPGKLPSDNLKIVVERVYDHHVELKTTGDERTRIEEFTDAILDVMRDINLYQSLKTDAQRTDKVLTSPDAVNYWNFLKQREGRMIVDSATVENCKYIVEKLKNDPAISDLLKLNKKDEWWDSIEIFNEYPMEMKLKKYNFGLKGILDNIVIDPGNGVIRINDLKKTNKSLKDFTESITNYRYFIQAAIYNLLVTNAFSDLIKKGFKVEFRFIVIDKHTQFYPFLVSDETMKSWTKELQKTLQAVEYHYVNKDYTLPYEFKMGEVVL